MLLTVPEPGSAIRKSTTTTTARMIRFRRVSIVASYRAATRDASSSIPGSLSRGVQHVAKRHPCEATRLTPSGQTSIIGEGVRKLHPHRVAECAWVSPGVLRCRWDTLPLGGAMSTDFTRPGDRRRLRDHRDHRGGRTAVPRAAAAPRPGVSRRPAVGYGSLMRRRRWRSAGGQNA